VQCSVQRMDRRARRVQCSVQRTYFPPLTPENDEKPYLGLRL
jgi:hypothetical protein